MELPRNNKTKKVQLIFDMLDGYIAAFKSSKDHYPPTVTLYDEDYKLLVKHCENFCRETGMNLYAQIEPMTYRGVKLEKNGK
jgi:hypothetical protein